MAPDARVRGFSLLEAVVALAILAAAGLALFAGMSQSLQMVGRAERAREIDSAMRNALAVVETINPMQTPTGSQTIGDFEMRWHAESVEPVRDNTTGYAQPGLYEVGLYRLSLQLWRDRVLEHEAEVRRTGFRQVREPAVL